MKTRRNLKLLVPAFLTALALVFTGCDNPLEDLTETTYYTVTFNSNGGSDVEAQKVESGTKATKPTDPTKASTDTETYAFGGWYTSTDDGTTLSDTAFDFETAITADITLYAKWNASEKTTTTETPEAQETPVKTYTITIAENIENGSVTASKTSDIKAGETITLTIAPATKYELDSLSVTALSSEQISESGNTKTFTMPAQNVTVTATFKSIFKSATDTKEVGDIVFNDGTAMSYTKFVSLDTETQDVIKTSAIALIFYKGTGLNSGDDTTTVRTLGVGLKHGTNIAWCSEDANAINTNITTIWCAPDDGGSGGNYTWTGNQDRNGKDNFTQIAEFLSAEGSGTSDDTTGEGAADRYPIFNFAKNYATQTVSNIASTSTYTSGWYIPSIAELFQIYANGKGVNKTFDIEAASQALGGDTFQSSTSDTAAAAFSSSSQRENGKISGTNYYKTLFFRDGAENFFHKKFAGSQYTTVHVCCIREF